MDQSLLVTGFGYEHDDAWTTNIDLFKDFTDVSRVRTKNLLLLPSFNSHFAVVVVSLTGTIFVEYLMLNIFVHSLSGINIYWV